LYHCVNFGFFSPGAIEKGTEFSKKDLREQKAFWPEGGFFWRRQGKKSGGLSFSQGTNRRSYRIFGVHRGEKTAKRAFFSGYGAPAAKLLWKGIQPWQAESCEMRKISENGVWKVFFQRRRAIFINSRETKAGNRLKNPSLSHIFRTEGKSASVVMNRKIPWGDEGYREFYRKQKTFFECPLNIYEAHWGRFKKSTEAIFLIGRRRMPFAVWKSMAKPYRALPLAEFP
jgi:1,4-alpha-glucan branching enzyme